MRKTYGQSCASFNISRLFTSSDTSKDKLVQNYAIDRDYYLNPDNRAEILHNIKARRLGQLQREIDKLSSDKEIDDFLEKELNSLPLRLDDKWLDYEHSEKINMDNYVVEEYDSPLAEGKFKKATNLGHNKNLLFTSGADAYGIIAGTKCYAFFDDLVCLQQALIEWTFNLLINEHGFTPVNVPHLTYESVVKACGFAARGKNTHTFTLKESSNSDDKVCLIGTSEIPLAGMYLGETFKKDDLPKKFCTVSRCYRAEFGRTHLDSGIYRVPYFTKVEMFAITAEDESDYILNEFVLIQKELFRSLNLRFRVLDMPPPELGLMASRKFDYEAWFPGWPKWGEISSASNCKDYQSRRLNIRYQSLNESSDKNNEPFTYNYVHTVNGTAIAIPRIISLLLEYGYCSKALHIPTCLQPYMNGQETLQDSSNVFLIRSHT